LYGTVRSQAPARRDIIGGLVVAAISPAITSPPATDTSSSSGCDCDHRDHGRDATTLTLSHLSKAIVAIYHYYYKQNLVHGNKFRNGLLHHHRYHQKQAAVSVVIYCYDK